MLFVLNFVMAVSYLTLFALVGLLLYGWVQHVLHERFVIRGADGTAYLTRYTILRTRFGALRLHHFHRGDADPELHDHPWWFLTLILKGGYWEHTKDPNVAIGGERMDWRGPGSLLFRPATWAHRVTLATRAIALRPLRNGELVYAGDVRFEPVPVWTLVVTGPERRLWGFHTACGWQYWKTFLDKRHRGIPVCEERDV